MSPLFTRGATILFSVLCVSCSHESPSAPSVTAGAVGTQMIRAEKPAGEYELSFLIADPPPGSGASSELHLEARVADRSSGAPATDGVVVFELCSLKGNSAPFAACETDSGNWQRIVAVKIDPDVPGVASVVFGPPSAVPSIIGFRFRYVRGPIADGIGGPADVGW